MFGPSRLRRILAIAAFVVGCSPMAIAADGGIWSVGKSSGEVWVTSGGAEEGSPISQVSLGSDNNLKAGDTIRTGRTGRVLLTRGEETILIAPNSVVGLPTESKDGMATTILQRAGSILLDVEKRNVKHFEVETPYLAAVVKGTHFSVTISAGTTKVAVERGQVEVADFKSGQIAQVLPGQAAMASDHGKPGLSLSGAGTFNPIEQGKPRPSSIERMSVPRGGLRAPHDAKGGAIHAMKTVDTSATKNAAASGQQRGALTTPAVQGTQQSLQQGNRQLTQQALHPGIPQGGRSVIHIGTAIGEVKLNMQMATHGLAHGGIGAGVRNSRGRDTASVWSNGGASSNTNGSGSGGNSVASAVASAIGSANASANASANGATGNGTIRSSTTSSTSSGTSTTSASAGSGDTTGNSSSGGGSTGRGSGSTGSGSGSGSGNSGSGSGNSGNGNSGNGNQYGWWWNNWWNNWHGHGRGG